MSGLRARSGRLLMYALALAGGAIVAHLSAPAPSGATARDRGGRTPTLATRAAALAGGTPPPAVPPLHVRGAPASIVDSTVDSPQVQRPRGAASHALLPTLEPAPPSVTGGPRDAMARALRQGKVITGSTPHRLILFTFDDGPDRRHTPLLLDRLDAERVRAVFFLTASRIQGRNVAERQQAAIAREIAARGHMVASHTLDHAQLPLLDDQAVLDQVIGAERVFKRVFGERPWLFRPPGGARSARVDALLSERGYTTVLWNLGAGDFQVRSAEDVFDTWRRVFERREKEEGERGGIVLLHDTYPWSVDAFQMILGDLRARNCELLARGEELFDIVDDPALFFQARDGAPASATAAPADPPDGVLARRQERLQERTMARCAGI